MWGSGYAISAVVEEDSALEELLFELHISFGVTLLFCLLLRIAVRLFYPPPPELNVFSRLEKMAAHAGHIALYVLPATIILIGWAETDFGGHGVEWFGVQMIKVFPTMETWHGINLESTTEEWHEILAYTMLAVVVVHIAAVIKHRRDGHDVLYRMTLGKQGDRE